MLVSEEQTNARRTTTPTSPRHWDTAKRRTVTKVGAKIKVHHSTEQNVHRKEKPTQPEPGHSTNWRTQATPTNCTVQHQTSTANNKSQKPCMAQRQNLSTSQSHRQSTVVAFLARSNPHSKTHPP